jgi:GH15 family glucan-1,4-alpha-glucosidase
MTLRIEDYALIGDCKTAALVGRDGSIDWLCWPRFDSAACFAALLGDADNGRWLLAPKDPLLGIERRYRPGTLVLETEFQTETGSAAVIDFMVPADGANLVRTVTGQSGRVVFQTELVVRFNYGATVPWVSRLADDTINVIAGPERLVLRTPTTLYGEDLKTVGEFAVEAGESIAFVLSYGPSFQDPPPPIDPFNALERTEAFWREWSNRCPDIGPWTEAVKRSLITLKALTYAPTGGIVAAPTTSLPERLGGVQNWDYRYCWLRDATFTLLAFMSLGYYDEARAWRDWLTRAIAGSPRQVQIMYGVGGERWLPELIVPTRNPRPCGSAMMHPGSCSSTSSARSPTRFSRPSKRAWSRPNAAARRVGISVGGVAATGRRHLGGPRRTATLRPLEGNGLGHLRSCSQ